MKYKKQAQELSKTYETNRIKGRFIWNKERIKEIKSYSLEELICNPYFLGLKSVIRDDVMEDIYELWEERKKRRIHMVYFDEGIGTGKTFKASIILWLQWLEITLHEPPQKYFGIDPTSQIAFVCSSRTEAQARKICFSKVKARFLSSFNRDYFPPNPRYTNEIQISRNNTFIYAGNSSALSVQGFNWYGGVMDECDEGKKLKEYILSNMISRFQDKAGMLIYCSSERFENFTFSKTKRKEDIIW